MAERCRTIRYDQLPQDALDRAIEILRPYVSDKRQARIEAAIASRTRDVVLVLEDIYDPHNASAVIRTAEAFGIFEIHIIERTLRFKVHPKTTSGAHKWIDLWRHPNAEHAYALLRARGYAIWVSDIHGDSLPVDRISVDRNVALVFGNEHEGLSSEARSTADGSFKIPMLGFVESLNVSVATAVSAYDILSRRRQAGIGTGVSGEEARALRAAWYARSVRAAGPLLDRAGLPVPVTDAVAAGEAL